MQQKIERLQAQLGEIKGKSKDTLCVSDTFNPLSQKLENENVELEFQVLNYAKENAHHKTTYKNLFDSISMTRTQAKTIIDSLQNKLHDTIYENAKLRAQLFDKVSDQKDTASGTSANTKFAKQSILGKPPKVGKTYALSKPVTSNSIPTPQRSKVVENVKVIAPGMFRINPFKTTREEKHVPNKVKASTRSFKRIHYRVVYFIEGLGHNLFSEIAQQIFTPSTSMKWPLHPPICLMARASSTKSWLWNQRLSHLNFDTINDLAKNDFVSGLPKFKYHKEHLCPSCEKGKSKRASHPPKPVPNSRQRLHPLHMDLCGQMRIACINGKR
nr:hypothetical protein [Tanacetum cinerariifolium]